MKKHRNIITGLVVIGAVLLVASTALFAGPPVPMSYSNEVKTVRYERVTDYIYAPGNTNMVMGWTTESTNWPSAILHCVTYGDGTNAIYRLWSQEVLPTPPEPWRIAEWVFYQAETWITLP